MTDAVAGQSTTYGYDALKRLTQATTTGGAAWSAAYTYDGFGNLTGKTGPAPWNGSVDPLTNRINGHCYDANGNMTVADTCVHTAVFAYDILNRLATASVTGGTERYFYTPDNKRVSTIKANGSQTLMVYGGKGEVTANCTASTVGASFTCLDTLPQVMFAGRLVRQMGSPVSVDRLGSVRVQPAGSQGPQGSHGPLSYLPYGEDLNTTFSDETKFGTYWQDSSTGLNYADQRYYNSIYGRFMTPDPYRASGGSENPGSWNRYAYTRNDPINRVDPQGMADFSVTVYCGPECGDYSGFDSRSGGGGANDQMQIVNDTLPSVDTQGGSGGSGSSPIAVQLYSTTSNQAIFVQNSLSWIQSAIKNDTDCDTWLQNNNQSIGYLLGTSKDLGSTQLLAGVGNFSDSSVNAVAGTAGTTGFPTNALLTVNVNGAFFYSSANVGYGVTGIAGGTDAARVFILLHELAHLTQAANFQEGDRDQKKQTANNMLVLQHCQKTINAAGGK